MTTDNDAGFEHDGTGLFTVHCDFNDGSRSTYDGLTMGDLLAIIGTLDNLDFTECSIEPCVSEQATRPIDVDEERAFNLLNPRPTSEAPRQKVVDLMAALEQSLVDAKAARVAHTREGDVL